MNSPEGKSERSGPVEDLKWTERLKARVVTPGSGPRVHGYDVRGDMLGAVSFSDFIFLTLTGELPEEKESSVFQQVMLFLAPVSVAQAPVHAAVLSGLCGSGSSGITGVCAVTLAEQARWQVSRHGSLLEIMERDSIQPPSNYLVSKSGEASDTESLIQSLSNVGVELPVVFSRLKPISCAIAVLYRYCGIKDPKLLETVLVMSRLPCALAEGRAVQPGDFRSYPIDLPRFEYTGEEDRE